MAVLRPGTAWAFVEQVIRPGFAIWYASGRRGISRGLLKGRSARIVMTPCMPVLPYRLYIRAHSLRTAALCAGHCWLSGW
jgi:hypothetical protein